MSEAICETTGVPRRRPPGTQGNGKRQVTTNVPALIRSMVFIDIESTGTDVMRDRVIEIGVVVLKPDGTRTNWSSRFNPQRLIPPEATRIHGITDADVAEAPLFCDVAPRLHRGLQGKDLAGYNLRRFDLPLLDEEFRRCGMNLPVAGVRIVDCLGIFAKKQPRKLEDAVRRYCGREHSEAHGAAQDAAATVDVFLGQLQAYADLQAMDVEAIADFSLTSDNKPADLAGKLYFDRDGKLRYAFGKCRDIRVEDDPGYGRWMLSRDFPGSTLDVLRAELDRASDARSQGRAGTGESAHCDEGCLRENGAAKC
jgi:DNA polymerase-3 subunit epsilon